MDCVAYFRELLLDLYLATSENVSRSPGFEKYLVYAAQATQGQDAAGDDDDAVDKQIFNVVCGTAADFAFSQTTF